MNKPKSTVIELTVNMIDSACAVLDHQVARVAYPGDFKVWRKGGKIFLEVFHNDV